MLQARLHDMFRYDGNNLIWKKIPKRTSTAKIGDDDGSKLGRNHGRAV